MPRPHHNLLLGIMGGSAETGPPGPVPTPIITAKKVFIANAGGDEPWDSEAQFSGGPERAYDEFYAAMKNWGRYQLVNAPGDADLWFEIAFATPALAGAAARIPILWPAGRTTRSFA